MLSDCRRREDVHFLAQGNDAKAYERKLFLERRQRNERVMRK